MNANPKAAPWSFSQVKFTYKLMESFELKSNSKKKHLISFLLETPHLVTWSSSVMESIIPHWNTWRIHRAVLKGSWPYTGHPLKGSFWMWLNALITPVTGCPSQAHLYIIAVLTQKIRIVHCMQVIWTFFFSLTHCTLFTSSYWLLWSHRSMAA